MAGVGFVTMMSSNFSSDSPSSDEGTTRASGLGTSHSSASESVTMRSSPSPGVRRSSRLYDISTQAQGSERGGLTVSCIIFYRKEIAALIAVQSALVEIAVLAQAAGDEIAECEALAFEVDGRPGQCSADRS